MRRIWLATVIAGCGGNAVTTTDASLVQDDAPAVTVDALSSPTLVMTPPIQTFGNVGVGESSLTFPFTLTYLPVTPTAPTTTGSLTATLAPSAEFSIITDGCTGKSIGDGATCTVLLAFAPSAMVPVDAILSVTDGTLTAKAAVSGTGVQADNIEVVTPGIGTFPSEPLTVSTAPITYTVKNVGMTTSSVPMVRIGGANRADFVLASNTCTAAIPAAGTCTFAVKFVPTATGPRTAMVTEQTSSNTVVVQLTGTGLAGAQVSIAPTSFDFGMTTTGTPVAATTFTILNAGDSTTPTFGVTLGGANANQFAIDSTTCTGTLGAGASCTAAVHYAAIATGPKTATVNAGAGSATITGAAVAP